jgi:hypothetical protein
MVVRWWTLLSIKKQTALRVLSQITEYKQTVSQFTVGYYIPTRHHAKQTELDALKQAAMALEQLLVSHGVTEDELCQAFRALRKRKE